VGIATATGCSPRAKGRRGGPWAGPATLIGSTDEATMRWFILVVALLLDPAAVLLLLAATQGRRS
jgi:hypothetical protein